MQFIIFIMNESLISWMLHILSNLLPGPGKQAAGRFLNLSYFYVFFLF